ncbi:membrane protein insertion efficiency factor YidD [Candidatus Daviesbacteria bacterium]|nr:membrane protein insertion efficiency factor YidD [Candidatus Daviesbacteria bacterium]
MKRLLGSLISVYQTYLSFDRGLLSVFAPGGACRFSPTCSEYTKLMIGEFGAFRGSWMGLKRLWRCR